MARHMIRRPNGEPSPYFWSDKHGADASARTVFKKTETGVTRMKGVQFDAKAQKIRKV
jgi:hypothetical protein